MSDCTAYWLYNFIMDTWAFIFRGIFLEKCKLKLHKNEEKLLKHKRWRKFILNKAGNVICHVNLDVWNKNTELFQLFQFFISFFCKGSFVGARLDIVFVVFIILRALGSYNFLLSYNILFFMKLGLNNYVYVYCVYLDFFFFSFKAKMICDEWWRFFSYSNQCKVFF